MTKKPSSIAPKFILVIFILGLFVIGYGAKTTEEITTIWTFAGIILLAISLVSLFFYEGLGTYYKTSYGIATVSSALSDAFKELDEQKEHAKRKKFSSSSEAGAQPAQATSPTSTYTPPWIKKAKETGSPAPTASPVQGTPSSTGVVQDVPKTGIGAPRPIKTGKLISLELPEDAAEKKKKESEEAHKLRKYYKEYRRKETETEEEAGARPEAAAPPPTPFQEEKEVPEEEPEAEKELPAEEPEGEVPPIKETKKPPWEDVEEKKEKEKKGIQVLSEDELEDDVSYREIIERNF